MVPVLHNRARMTLPEDHRNRRNDQGQDEVLDVNYLGRYASTTLAAFELFLS